MTAIARSLLALALLAATALGQLVPASQSLTFPGGEPIVGNRVRCLVPEFRPQAAAFVDALQRMGATDAELVEDGKAAVYFAGNAVGPGGRERSFHTVVAMSGHLQVIAADPTSAANAAATLLQLVEIQDGTCA